MPRAAVPDYLGQHFKTLLEEASPGMRFGMYLPIWTTRDEQNSKEPVWSKNDSAALKAWETITALGSDDRRRMRALADRQDGLIAQLADNDHLSVDAIGIAPFVTGMGNEHPLENGFAFLNPHGLPYLPGSGIKGVLRAAAEELAGDPRRDWKSENTFGWDQMFDINQKERRSAIELLFGHDPQDGQKADAPLFRGLLDIWDVIPRLDKGSNLMVEVMTPHQKEYYEGNATPHDSGQPIPIKFLAVPPGARFTFHLRIDRARMQALGVTDTLGKVWQDLMRAAFDHAFEWLGFGAKTSLGYGAMAIDSSAAETRREKQKAQAEQRAAAAESALLESLSEEDRERHEAEKRIAAFRACTQEARKQPYQPGGVYDQERNDFIKVVTQWDDPGLRGMAADALVESFDGQWGASKKKVKDLKAAINSLRGE